ncbi:MAG: GNAT family N-acetyltransferase [Cellvibrio sp. 79]|nr:MAG: GNAT family N-acetyltransferase [Cellvibrio sp. 79]
MDVRFINSIHDVGAQQWNQLCSDDYPFSRYEFLSALEDSGCTTSQSGWQVAHLLVYEDQDLLAAMPGYIKYHSYGEYVFDWAWADAYQRFGFNYYPKWINAIPFTPCTGPRLLTRTQHESAALIAAIGAALEKECELKGYSGWHCLFPTEDRSTLFLSAGAMQRLGCQFHWFNHNYDHFDDFLARMASRKRKNITKERNQVKEQGITFVVKEGTNITTEDMDLFYALYRNTYLKRSGHTGYLSQDFFHHLAKTFNDFIVLICAVTEQQTTIAAALFFRDQHTLYGRYWGCFEEYQFLHFETCYYQGIEFAIANKLQRFDGGAQGEHKIARGFEPVVTYSNHAITSNQFRSAIENFLVQERNHIQTYIQEAVQLLPFKND